MLSNEKQQMLDKAFSPTKPIREKDFFFGRLEQLEKIVSAINEVGRHAILYGERGVGKTSLANIMCRSISDIYPVKVTCSRNDSFKSIWLNVFQQIKLTTKTDSVGFLSEIRAKINSLEGVIANKSMVGPTDIINSLQGFQDQHFLFVFDEFDTINNNRTRSAFSDLIKSLSDNIDNITIVIVGISDNVENLIENHQSLERCLIQIKMPRMSNEEIEQIVIRGFLFLDITIQDDTLKKIVDFSSGFPHYAHLLCKYCAFTVMNEERVVVTNSDLKRAINLGVENTSEQLRTAYRKAIMSSVENSQWKDVLFACATSKCDEFDCFSTTEVTENYRSIANKRNGSIIYNLGRFCREERGNILEKIGIGRNFKYRFVNPMMKAFIKLNMNKD